MPLDNEAFLKHLLATFRVEADEHLRAMVSLVLELEQPAPAERLPQLVETLFREAHSLKGAARAVGLSEVEAACTALESPLAALKRQEIALSPALLETLDRRIDTLGRLLAGEEAAVPRPPPAEMAPPIEAPAPVGVPAPAVERSERPSSPVPDAAGTVRISTARLTALLVQAEDLLAFKFSAGHLAGELRTLHAEVSEWKKACGTSAREVGILRRMRERAVNGARGERLPSGVDKLCDAVERDERVARSLHERLGRLLRTAEQERRTFGGIVNSLQEDMKQALMQPFAGLLELLPKLVRDLARDSGKQVELCVDGAAIEIDRRILEQMKDPLIHLVRNAIDHGVEVPAERARRGKPPRGRLAIAVTPKDGNQIEVLIADDGAGIDVEKVTAAARKLGLVVPQDAGGLSRDDALALIYESGLSTSAILTDISGRGLGLAIVREKVEKLGGRIAIELPESGGTQFRIVLPTTLANFRGLLVAVGDSQFVLPARSVERVARVESGAIRTVENREAIELEGQAVALVRLSEVLGVPIAAPAGEDDRHVQLAVLASGGKRIAFVVDAVLGDQEVLVKGLGPQLKRVRNIAGATVLGPGRLVPILSVPDLMKSALRARPAAAIPAPESARAPRRAVLVVEDSITSRSLLKNILESSGYDVATAVDGIDALTLLHDRQFDVVVSDVEMPRMDGFDLTAHIRQDRKFAALPVVLVTALESRAHKERGIDVGANAYIVKSSFDQSNLIEAIRRLT
ncbi:CheA signal transduction histidine kinase [Aromatoleum tolulyticum]|uniref:Chemotaxis protein CheA n=1 Tax=Aromatoleum tolulyticum TaxID=34027 RepID=A0A1N6N422_9RHOO|nr:response regulator [Aromatoleum tolulyticum]SIP86824.1 CheA signal transduction histidine kinase [Aromatoleum tolulyticum]